MEWTQLDFALKAADNNIQVRYSALSEKDFSAQFSINAHSTLGQLLAHVDTVTANGCLFLLGNNENGFTAVNQLASSLFHGCKTVIAYDVWGGLFVIGNGDFPGDTQNIWYFSPDTLQWENLNIKYTRFIIWICKGDLPLFYKSFMWKDFSKISAQVRLGQAILVYPFLWSKECDLESASKNIVPISELMAMNAEYAQKFNR